MVPTQKFGSKQQCSSARASHRKDIKYIHIWNICRYSTASTVRTGRRGRKESQKGVLYFWDGVLQRWHLWSEKDFLYLTYSLDTYWLKTLCRAHETSVATNWHRFKAKNMSRVAWPLNFMWSLHFSSKWHTVQKCLVFYHVIRSHKYLISRCRVVKHVAVQC